MADREEHTRAMVGDLVLTVATLKAEGDALKLENDALRRALAEAQRPQLADVAQRPQRVESRTTE
jgi:regulator of replication initiation timing